jgi:integrase/recombinase XerD
MTGPSARTAAPRMVLPVEAWPARDQTLWRAGLAEGDDLEDPRYAASLSSATIHNAACGYGRFLAVEAGHCPLDASPSPAQRVTPAAVNRFMTALRAAGNGNGTITQRMWELRTAMGILEPAVDFRWLTSPGGNAIRALLPALQRPVAVHHPRELRDWGLDLIARAPLREDPLERAVQHRNGLLLAMLAVRAPRQRSLAALTLGEHVVRSGDEYRLVFTTGDLKTQRHLEYPLPASLAPAITAYLEVHRPVLLQGARHAWFWVNKVGHRLRQGGIEGVVRRASKARFGTAFGTHRFRHSAATVALLTDPTHPGSVAAMLGASPAVVQAHYNRGERVAAAAAYQAVLAAERDRWRDRTAQDASARKPGLPRS